MPELNLKCPGAPQPSLMIVEEENHKVVSGVGLVMMLGRARRIDEEVRLYQALAVLDTEVCGGPLSVLEGVPVPWPVLGAETLPAGRNIIVPAIWINI